mgnify:CR=1 FL=1
MGQILHGRATTTEAVRRAIQNSQESLRTLAKRYGIKPKTVEKCKKRGSTADVKTGPKAPKSTVLTDEEEALVVTFREHTLLAVDGAKRQKADHAPQAQRRLRFPEDPQNADSLAGESNVEIKIPHRANFRAGHGERGSVLRHEHGRAAISANDGEDSRRQSGS